MFGKKKYENMTQAEKLRYSYIKRYGSEEAYKEHVRQRGAKGGRAKVPKGFGVNRELAREAGRRGGLAKASNK